MTVSSNGKVTSCFCLLYITLNATVSLVFVLLLLLLLVVVVVVSASSPPASFEFTWAVFAVVLPSCVEDFSCASGNRFVKHL